MGYGQAETVTIHGQRNFRMLQGFVLPVLQNHDIDITGFMQDDSPPHMDTCSMQHIDNRVILGH